MQLTSSKINAEAPKRRFLYIFLDEAGNFDFESSGTKYFLMGCISKERPFQACKEMTDLKYDLIENGISIEYFHASEDTQDTRNRVFEIIRKNLDGVLYDAVVVEKSKVPDDLKSPKAFYPHLLTHLLDQALERYHLPDFSEVIVFTDNIPVQKKRKSIEKAIKETLHRSLSSRTKYRIFHHDSKSNFDLQVSDYFNWAAYRKWTRDDFRSYQIIETCCNEFEVAFPQKPDEATPG